LYSQDKAIQKAGTFQSPTSRGYRCNLPHEIDRLKEVLVSIPYFTGLPLQH